MQNLMVNRYADLHCNDVEVWIKSHTITKCTITFSTDATIDFTGKLQTAYCGTEKVLYEIYVCSDDEEEVA